MLLCISSPGATDLICKGLDSIQGFAGHTVFVVITPLYQITRSIHRQLVKLTEWLLSNKTLFMDGKIRLCVLKYSFFSTTKKYKNHILAFRQYKSRGWAEFNLWGTVCQHPLWPKRHYQYLLYPRQRSCLAFLSHSILCYLFQPHKQPCLLPPPCLLIFL